MAGWRSVCIGAYAAATEPYRWWVRRRLARQGKLPVCGLFYHRVADDHPNAWTLSTSQFDRQINWLQQHCDLVSLAEAQRRIREGNDQRVAVSLTFDDGYADNCLHAIPVLLSRRIPFTYFVTTHFLENGLPFPHDQRAGRPLSANSIDEIKALNDAGVEIGVHTRTHLNLGEISGAEQLRSEILGAREDIKRWIGRQPRYFAFPFGLPANLNPQAIQLLYDEGFDGFCSAFGGYNMPGGDAFHFRRFHADPDLRRVRNWLSCDPRWLCAPPSYDYQIASPRAAAVDTVVVTAD